MELVSPAGLTVEVGNIYGHGFAPDQTAKLEALGFVLRQQISHYPGSQICRFFDFAWGPSLELIEVADPGAYLAFAPEGMIPYCPGISLIVTSDHGLSALAEALTVWEPYQLHVGYDGSDSPDSPGWNYLNFGTPIVEGTFVWLTTYDEPVPQSEPLQPHPNGAYAVQGLLFDLDLQALDGLRGLVGEPASEAGFHLGGVHVWPRSFLADLPTSGPKDFPLRAVVIGVDDLGTWRADSDASQSCTFNGHPARLAPTNSASWDILLVEGREGRAAQAHDPV